MAPLIVNSLESIGIVPRVVCAFVNSQPKIQAPSPEPVAPVFISFLMIKNGNEGLMREKRCWVSNALSWHKGKGIGIFIKKELMPPRRNSFQGLPNSNSAQLALFSILTHLCNDFSLNLFHAKIHESSRPRV